MHKRFALFSAVFFLAAGLSVKAAPAAPAPPQAVTVHSATVKWSAPVSSPDPVTGYNILRGSIQGGPYVAVNSAPVSVLNYTDLTVTGGATYFFVVESVDASGNSSVPSPEVKASIPPDGLAPGCMASNGVNWTNSAIAPQGTSFVLKFDATPSQPNADAVVGLAGNAPAGYADLDAIVRFNPAGTVDAYTGTIYAASNAVPYSSGAYHFRLVVNPVTKTFDAFVTPPAGTEIQIASSYGFRSQTIPLINVSTYSETGSVTVCNVTVAPPPPPPPAITITIAPKTITLIAGGATQQFTATVGNSTDTALLPWSVTGVGTINATGLYTAPTTSGTAVVIATSHADPTKQAMAQITVNVPAPPVSIKFSIGDTFKVVANGSRLNVHSTATPIGTVTTTLADGSIGTITAGPTLSGAVTFWKMSSGWISEQFIRQ